MKLIFLQLTAFLFIPIISGAQEKTKLFKITDIQLILTSNTFRQASATIDDFRTLVPNSTILQQDFSDYEGWSYQSFNSDSELGILTGISIKGKTNSQLRLGLNYGARHNMWSNYYESESYIYDTLTSSQTGQQYYLDSTVSKSLSMDQSAELINLDASYIFRTNQENRWTFFIGLGMNIGIGFNSITTIHKNQFSTSPNNYGSPYDNTGTEFESIKNQNYFASSLFIPMGLNFRIGKKSEFWQKLHFFYEMRPTIRMQSLQQNSVKFNVPLGNGIGLRVKW